MAGFVWQEDFSVGIPSIDEQHKRLVEMIDVDNSDQEPDRTSFQERFIKALAEYARYHFDYEERLLKENGYGALEHQQEEHKKFILAIADYELRLEQGKALSVLELYQFLTSWLVNHILGSDKKYAEFLKSKGIT